MTLVGKAMTARTGRIWALARGGFLTGAFLLGASAVSAQGKVTIVEMTGTLQFVPQNVTISAGETVEWRNGSAVAHTVTGDPDKAADPGNVQLPGRAEAFSSGMVAPGGTYSHTFEIPGRYQYVCLPHEAAGMIGEVIVGE